MKSFTTSLLLAAGAASTVYAEHGHHARHQDLHERQLPAYMAKPHPAPSGASSCGCYSYTTTWYGAPTFIPDLRDYTNTTSAGWETVVPEATSTPSASSEAAAYEPSATSEAGTWKPRRKGTSEKESSSDEPESSSHIPTIYGKKASSTSTSCSDEATSSHTPTIYGKKASVTSSWSSVVPSYNKAPGSDKPESSHVPTVYGKKASVTASSAYVAKASSYEKPSAAPSSSSVASSSTAEASSYTAPSSSSTSSSAAPSSTNANNTITPNGDKWAFCYTPYANDGNCKTADAVASDVAGIKAKGFTSIRLYATDCDGPENVGAAAAKEGLKLILGIWVDESGIGSKTDAQVETLTKWGKDQWDLVEMVVAGNEAMFYGYTTAEGLAGFVNDVRSKFRAAGYNGPVGTSEVPGTFIQYADVLCPAVDYAGANIHPFFNTDISAEGAGDFVVKILDNVAKACNYEKEAYNLESGWPSLGSANGMAIPGAEDQKVAIKSIMEKAGGKTAVFSYENDAWKAPGEFGVEQHWGCADLFDSQ
jgi:exo-beta-1,3-glucanase (GH17 family)